MDDNEPTEQGPQSGVQVTARVVGLDELTPQYVNILHVNNDPMAFQVVFSQYIPPLAFEPEEIKRITEQGFVEARPVARLIMTPMMVQQTIEVLTKQLAIYQDQGGQPAPADEDNADA